jgi:membrane protease YdiL (CAAX protease family)
LIQFNSRAPIDSPDEFDSLQGLESRPEGPMRVTVFATLALALSWTLWYALAPHLTGLAIAFLAAAYMFGPLVAALITAAIFDRGRIGRALGVRAGINLWYAVAWLAAPVVVFSGLGVALLVPGNEPQSHLVGIEAALRAAGQPVPENLASKAPALPMILAISMVAGVIPNAIFAFGEEAGWRGYLWGALRPGGFWKASLATGLLWGVWHAPLIVNGHNYGVVYPGAPWSGVAMMTLFCVALSPLMGLIRDRSGASIAPAIFHGTLNALASVAILLQTGTSLLVTGPAGAAAIVAIGVVTAFVVLLRPNRAPRG